MNTETLNSLKFRHVLILSSHANFAGILLAPSMPGQPWAVKIGKTEIGTDSPNAAIWFEPSEVKAFYDTQSNLPVIEMAF